MSDDLQGIVERAAQLLRLDRDQEAIETAHEGLRLDPQHPRLLLITATAQLSLNLLDLALDTAGRAIAAAPEAARPQAVRGWTLHCLGRGDEAAEVLRGAVALDPTDDYCRRLLVSALCSSAGKAAGRLRAKARGRLTTEAREHLEVLLSLAPEEASSFNAAAHLAIVEQQPIAARTALERALRIDPNNARSHQLLGVVAEMQGDVGRAGDHYLESARLDPTSRRGLDRIRTMSVGAGVGGFALFFLLRTIFKVGTLVGATAGRVIIGVAGAVAIGALVVAPIVRVRNALSPEARTTLSRDRKLRGSRVEWRPIIKTVVIAAVTIGVMVILPGKEDDDVPDEVQDSLRSVAMLYANDPATGVSGRLRSEGGEFVPDCTALAGRDVAEGGLGTHGCALSDPYRTIAPTRRVTCGGTMDVLAAGIEDEQVHGEVGGRWVPGAPPRCPSP